MNKPKLVQQNRNLATNVNYHTTEDGTILVSTIKTTDSPLNMYETAIQHPHYRSLYDKGSHLIIVEEYKTKSEALIGHMKWVSLISIDALPKILFDVSTSYVMLAMDKTNSSKTHRKYERTTS